MTNIKIKTDSDVCNAMKEALGGYTTAHGREVILEATAAQHFNLPKGKPARFVRNGILETCLCRDCAALSASPAPDPVRTALADTSELLERAEGYLRGIPNKGDCGPHHLVSDLYGALRNAVAALRAPPQSVGNPLDAKGTIDKYGIALMMISQGCSDPVGVASKALTKRWLCKACGWQGEMPNTKVLPDAMGTAQTPCCPDCDQHAALSLSLPEGEGLQAIDPLHSTSEGK